jgi:hypothetical protein
VFDRAIKLASVSKSTLSLPLDDVITILRHYEWNRFKMEEKWFDDSQNLSINLGIEFDSKVR